MSEKTVVQSESMLVRHEHLDKLLLLAGEVIIASSNQGLAYRALESLFARNERVSHEVLETTKDLSTTTATISADLHRLVQSIRTVTLNDLSFRARRLVRDVARKTGKRIQFDFFGEETTVDKSIVEKLYDPVAHQLRNAVDHGIEDPRTRQRAGKPEEGLITLRAHNTEQETIIEITDNGAGVNLEGLRRKGIDQGLVDPSASFNEDDALRLMCMPGVSTVSGASISEVSGRGVGMDVVYSQITELGGSVTFRTTPGEGSVFTFRVPLVSAVNIMDALVVRAGGFMLAFPISSVVTTMSVTPDHVNSTLGRGRTVKYLEHLVPLHNLCAVLDDEPSVEDDIMLSILIVEHKESRVALVVSEFHSPQKLVIIPFNEALEVEGLSGSTILGGRQLGFIVDVATLIDMCEGRSARRRQRRTDAVTGASAADQPAETGSRTAREVSSGAGDDAPMSREDEEAAAEFVREFLMEIQRLLPPLNEAVFHLETNPHDEEQINAAFRLFHTIKGNLIMMGLPRGGETVHGVESVLDALRNNKIEPSPELTDVLMDGISYIEEITRLSEAGQWEDHVSTELREQCSVLLPTVKPVEETPKDILTAEFRYTSESAYRAVVHRRRGTPLYQCYIEFEAGAQPAFLVACLIHKRACELGDVLASAPTLDDIEQGVMDGRMKLLLASDRPAELVEDAFPKFLTRYYGATHVTIGRI